MRNFDYPYDPIFSTNRLDLVIPAFLNPFSEKISPLATTRNKKFLREKFQISKQ